MDKLDEQYAFALREYINKLLSRNNFYTHIVSFDPGGTTGIAIMNLNDPSQTWTTNLKYDGNQLNGLNYIIEQIDKTYLHNQFRPLVVVENFRARAGRAIATTGFINVPERIIGAIQTICKLKGYDFFLVEPDEHKNYVSNNKTKVFHLFFGIPQPKVIHERDALTILHYGLYKFSR